MGGEEKSSYNTMIKYKLYQSIIKTILSALFEPIGISNSSFSLSKSKPNFKEVILLLMSYLLNLFYYF